MCGSTYVVLHGRSGGRAVQPHRSEGPDGALGVAADRTTGEMVA